MQIENKTIFIVVTRGFIIRNILRSGVLDYLKATGLRIVILIRDEKNNLPQYLKDEFEDVNVIVEGIREYESGDLFGKIYRRFIKLSSYLVYAKHGEAYNQAGNAVKSNKSRTFILLEKLIYAILSKIKFFKYIIRFFEIKMFKNNQYKEIFDRYCPDLVFSTSIISKLDIGVMKEARCRNIKTVSMPKGWDNICRILYRVVPDHFIVQNGLMKTDAVKYQLLNPDNISVCGFPQFDWYKRPEIIMDRKVFFDLLGLDYKKKLIFFGSEGFWAPNDDYIAEILTKLVNSSKIFEPASLFIRPHFSDIKRQRFVRFQNIPNVKVDNHITLSDFFSDNWDPNIEETKIFINAIYHCDIMVMIASTLALDAACFNKPIIGAAFKVLFNPRTKQDVSAALFQTDHYAAVVDTNAVDIVNSETQLEEKINYYLKNPLAGSEEREKMLLKLCYKVDGLSSKRVGDCILGLLKK